MESTLLLVRHAQKVTLVHRQTKFQELRDMDHMELLLAYKVTQWITNDGTKGETTLRGVRVRLQEVGAESTTQTLECDGAFIMIGSMPNTDYLQRFVDLGGMGLVTTLTGNGSYIYTPVEGVFVAGEAAYYNNIIKKK